MLATSDRNSASSARKRAARNPAATRATSTSGSKGTRITSSAPASSASRNSRGESSAAAATMWTDASSRRLRTADVSSQAQRAPAITTGTGRSVRTRSAPATSKTRSSTTPASSSTAQQASSRSSNPSTSTLAPSAPRPSSALAECPPAAVAARGRGPLCRRTLPSVSDIVSPHYRLPHRTSTPALDAMGALATRWQV